MELTTWSMYWLVKLDEISALIFGIGLAIAVVLVFTFFAWRESEEHRPVAIFAAVCAIILIISGLLCPNTKQMAAIIIVPKIINDERVQNVPDKILELGLEWLEELRPDGKGK